MGTIAVATTCTKAGGGYFTLRKVSIMSLEIWLMDLLKDIKEAAEKGENYDLHLEADYVKDIATAYDELSWIEIY